MWSILDVTKPNFGMRDMIPLVLPADCALSKCATHADALEYICKDCIELPYSDCSCVLQHRVARWLIGSPPEGDNEPAHCIFGRPVGFLGGSIRVRAVRFPERRVRMGHGSRRRPTKVLFGQCNMKLRNSWCIFLKRPGLHIAIFWKGSQFVAACCPVFGIWARVRDQQTDARPTPFLWARYSKQMVYWSSARVKNACARNDRRAMRRLYMKTAF